MPQPKGSGYFSLCFGFLFLGTFIISFIYDFSTLNPYLIFQIWLLFTSIILLTWGVSRIKNGENNWHIGQPTINFTVGIIGVTIALLRLFVIVKP